MQEVISLHLGSIHTKVGDLAADIIEAHNRISRTQYPNLNGDVYILENGRATLSESVSDIRDVIRSGSGAGIKTNRIEHYSPKLTGLAEYIRDLFDSAVVSHVTLHVFESTGKTESFPLHTDPADVVLCMLVGSKRILVDDGYRAVEHQITANNPLYIPMHVPHQAFNDEDSLMLSIGIERYTSDHIDVEG